MTWLPPVVIFDLDDTLINFTAMAEELWRVICDESAPGLGLEGGALHAALMTERVSFWADPELNRFGRHNLGEASRAVVSRAFTALGVGTAEQAATLARQYSDRRHDLVHLYEESIATIEELRARGHRLAMITNGGAESQRAKIVRFGLASHFDYILVEGEFGIGKPDERVYRHVRAELGVEASDAMMVGDDVERDVAGPQKVGMRGVWIDRAGKGLPPGCVIAPDRIIGSLAELL